MTSRWRLTAVAAVATLAAASGLAAVFNDFGWLQPVAGGIAVVAIVSELARSTRVAAALGPVLAAAAMLLYVTAIEAGDKAYGGVIPTGASLRALGDLARNGFDDIRSLATPVPTHQSLVLLAVVGIAAVELVVDLIAVTLRRAAVAGLPLLAVFALCTSVSRHGVGWIPFANATAGYLWLLLTDAKDRVGRWGRTIGTEPAPKAVRGGWADLDATPSPLSALGRRVGLTAIAVAVVVPLLVPGLHGGLPKHGGNGLGNGGGSSRTLTINPIVSMTSFLKSSAATPVITMRSTDPSPVYLRLTSLDAFDGRTFSPSELTAKSGAVVSDGFQTPPVSGVGVSTQIAVSPDLSVHYLPVPTQAENVDLKGDWHYDAGSNTIFSARTTTKGAAYTVASIRDEPTAAELTSAPAVTSPGQLARYLALPPLPASIRNLADAVTTSSPAPFQKALAIQNYLLAPPFRYSTQVPPANSATALEDFLLKTKQGFCQQYATAMAVMARLEGIPSRVAVGFTHGQRQADGTWVITTHDAHAWPELYFPGYGWLPFEPTPRSDGQAIRPTFTQAAPNGGNDNADVKKEGKNPTAKAASGAPATARVDRADGADTAVIPPATPTHQAHHRSRTWWLVGLAVLLVGLAAPGTARVVVRRRRHGAMSEPSAATAAAWAELRDTFVDAGIDWSDTVTPRTVARMVTADAGLDRHAREALAQLVRAEERARYAPAAAANAGGANADLGAGLWEAVSTVRTSLTRAQERPERILAAVMPRSTRRSLHAAAGRVADALDGFDRLAARLRRAVTRLLPRPA